jgi:hypothetical protein
MKKELKNKPSYAFYIYISDILTSISLRNIFMYNEHLLAKKDKKIEMLKDYEMQRLKIKLN